MATPAQARLERLFQNKSRPLSVEKQGGLVFWEKELIESQQRRQPKSPVRVSLEEDPGSSADDDGYGRAHTLPLPEKGHEVSASKEQPIYLPRGRGKGGLPLTELDIEQCGDEPDLEPASSNHELIGRFCIFSLVAKFPYKYMYDPESIVSKRFFAGEKVYQRNWNMYYLLRPDQHAYKPLMLVPLEQVGKLVEEIAQEFDISVGIPEYPFQISFYKDGTPNPSFICSVNSKADMTNAQSAISNEQENSEVLQCNRTDTQMQDYAAWKEKVERAFEAEKKKASATKKKGRKQEMIVKENTNAIKRAQRYLGLQERLPTTEAFQSNVRSEYKHLQDNNHAGFCTGVLDSNKPAPFPFEDNTIMISVDVESWEMDHSIITEIGLSTLDTLDIEGITMGPQGNTWIRRIRSRHFRIKGREDLRNFKFCQGYPEMFLFGTSEAVSVEEAPDIIDSCFEYPYSAGFECEEPRQIGDASSKLLQANPLLNTGRNMDIVEDKARTIILVGHDIDGDIDYLSSLGSAIFGADYSLSSDGKPSRRQRVLSSIRERLDTASLYKAFKQEKQPRSLMKVCSDLDITPQYAHNAGNDARYTLEAFIKMAIRSREGEDKAMEAALMADEVDFRKKRSSELRAERLAEIRMNAAKEIIISDLHSPGNSSEMKSKRRNASEFFQPESEPNQGAEDEPQESDSPNPSSQEITYKEATRRYLEKYGQEAEELNF